MVYMLNVFFNQLEKLCCFACQNAPGFVKSIRSEVSRGISTSRVIILVPHISMVGNRFDVFAMFIMLSICLSWSFVLSGGRAFFVFFSFLAADFFETSAEVVADACPLVVEIEGGAVLAAVFKAENERCGESKQLFFS